MVDSKVRVAICGGGITGATLANLLLKHQDKIEFHVYEAAKKFTEIGAGLVLWKRAMDVLKQTGLYDQCMRIAVKPDSKDPELTMKLRIGDQKPTGFDFGEWRHEGGTLFFRRAPLLDILVANIPPHLVSFRKHLVSYTDHASNSSTTDSGVTLLFEDGSSATADILVGCDGIKSAVRRQMYTTAASEEGASMNDYMDKYIRPAWSGSAAYRALIPATELEKINPNHSTLTSPMVYFGKEKHLIVYRPNETHIYMVAFVSDPTKEGTQYPDTKWVRDAAQEELFAAFEDLEDEVQDLFKFKPKLTLWAINALKKPLPFFVRGNVALMGDAAHAMTTHLAAGAVMSIEDASVLTTFLTSSSITHNPSSYPLALLAYNTARVQKTGEVHKRARDQGRVYEYGIEGVERNVKKIREWIKRNTDEVVRWDAEDDVRRGLEWIDHEVRKRTNPTGSDVAD